MLEWTAANLLIWVVFGMTGQVAVLAYPWLSSYFGAALSGRANTAVNLVLFLTAFFAQYAIGAIIDLFPPTAARRLRPTGYQVGFGAFLVVQIIALAWYLLGRRGLMPRRDGRSLLIENQPELPDARGLRGCSPEYGFRPSADIQAGRSLRWALDSSDALS